MKNIGFVCKKMSDLGVPRLSVWMVRGHLLELIRKKLKVDNVDDLM
jgi:hypothetical protein